MKLQRIVHIGEAFDWKPLSELAPDVQLAARGANGEPQLVELHGLAFAAPEGDEVHIFVLDEDGREELLKMLTGGLILPGQVIL